MNVYSSRKTGNYTFILIMVLFLVSFFDESEISALSFAALFSTLLIPLIMVLSFVVHNRRFNKEDKTIALFFAIFMLIQFIGIRWNDLYTSITPIYRSFSVLVVVLYFRNFILTNKIVRAFLCLSALTVVLGFATIFTPARENTNLLFGNYNTVGVLYFTLTVLNMLVYFKTYKFSALLLSFLNVAIILISNTRTALLLLIITSVLFILSKLISGKIIKPKVFFPLSLLLLCVFVYLYYNIKDLPFYEFLNEISQKLFKKNFDSGRPELWKITVQTVGAQWLTGMGTGIDLEFFYSTMKTPHSVFFDIYLQNGLLGVISYLLCIFVTLKKKGKWESSNLAIFIMIVSFIFIFYNSVGIVFTKARSGIGLLQWAIIALMYVCKKNESIKRSVAYDKSYCRNLQCQRIR